jgi:diguanylate cyclase (GGDEF)-like protein
VQIFFAVALFTAFPIAALLEERASLELSLQQREAQFRELANTDSLTGQGNRRAFDERLQTEWKRSTRPLALLSIDVDLFKSYNDIYGHIAGDDCLRRIASIAAHTVRERSTARLYRLGGEEFAAILPGADAAESFALAERIREAILAANIEHSGSPLGRQTVSIGVAPPPPPPRPAPPNPPPLPALPLRPGPLQRQTQWPQPLRSRHLNHPPARTLPTTRIIQSPCSSPDSA